MYVGIERPLISHHARLSSWLTSWYWQPEEEEAVGIQLIAPHPETEALHDVRCLCRHLPLVNSCKRHYRQAIRDATLHIIGHTGLKDREALSEGR